MSDRPARAWRCYLRDMIEFGEKVVAYTKGMDKSAFVGSALTLRAWRGRPNHGVIRSAR